MQRALLSLLLLLGIGLPAALWLGGGDPGGGAGAAAIGEGGGDLRPGAPASGPAALSPGDPGPSADGAPARQRPEARTPGEPGEPADSDLTVHRERPAERAPGGQRVAQGEAQPELPAELASARTVEGRLRVVDEQGQPVPGARVVWKHPKLERGGTVNEEGERRVKWPEGLSGRWSVAHPDFVDQQGAFDSLDPERQVVLVRSCTLEVALEARGGLLATALPAAEVRLWNSALPANTQRRGQGALHVESDLDPGSYDVFALHPEGVARPVFELELAPGEVRRVDLQLQPGADLEAQVFDGEGEPLADVLVRSRPASSGWPAPLMAAQSFSATSDRDGRVRFAGGLEGPVLLSAQRPDGRLLRESFYWGSESQSVELRFPPERERRVRLLTPDGAPVPGAALRFPVAGSGGSAPALLSPTSPPGVVEVFSDADGWCELGELPVGVDVALAALAPEDSGWADLWRAPEALPDATELRFEAGRSVEVLAQVEGSGPLAGVRVCFEAQDPSGVWTIASAVTDDEGLARLEDLPGRPGRFVGEYQGIRGQPVPRTPEDGARLELSIRLRYDLVGRAVDIAGRGLRAVPLELVRESADEGPTANASSGTVTGGNGVFYLRRLEAGDYLLRARSELWRTRGNAPLRFQVPREEPLELVLVEASRDPRASLVGRALDVDGAPIDDMEVRGANAARVLRDGAGFEVQGLTPRPTTLLFMSAGHLPVRLKGLDLQPGQTLDVGELRFDPALPVRVDVTAGDGAPVLGARVRLKPLSLSAGGPAPTSNGELPPVLTLLGDGQGHYRSPFAKPGSWRVIVEHDDHPRSESTWTPAPGSSGEALFEVKLGGAGD